MRYLLAMIAVLAVISGLATIKSQQIGQLIRMGKEMQKLGPPPEVVSTAPAKEQAWGASISAVGSISAARGVAISNDAAGVVARIHFESGDTVSQGQVLVELDSSVERASLASAIARRELASVNAVRTRALVKSEVLAPAQRDNDDAMLKATSADVGALQAQIDRKVVRAPFSGRLGIRTVNLGQYLSPGTALTTLEDLDRVYVDFTVPEQNLEAIKVGMPVRATTDGQPAVTIEGTIAAMDPSIDATTRAIKLRGALPNKQGKLRPGMFVQVAIVLPDRGAVVTVPVTALVHASYGDSVFLAEDKTSDAGERLLRPDGSPRKVARQQFVRVVESRGDFVALHEGVKVGEDVVVAGAFKLRNGAEVVVNNDVTTKPELAPKPENR
jgi:membrane fusion protein (multidrug efflux system)